LPVAWFNNVRAEFSKAAAPMAGKPIQYVEIGCWKGVASDWVCRNILTHHEARGVGIDHYPADWKRDQQVIDTQVKAEAEKRMFEFTLSGKWSWIFQRSQEALRRWDRGQIDLLYIDGSHLAHDVMMDWCYAWPHLRDGSIVIFDDLGIGRRKERRGIPHVPTATEAVTRCFGKMLEVVNPGGSQFAVRVQNKIPLGDQPV
jgi:predicted O-methyltransferase YrrM